MSDFSNFELGYDVAELAGELLPEMAEVFEIVISDTPTAEELGNLVQVIGTKPTLRENESGADAWLSQYTGSESAGFELAKDWLGRSGVQLALDRSLWTPYISTPKDAPVVLTGGVANWQDRTGTLVAGLGSRQVFMPTGNRLMNTRTEVSNPNVREFTLATGEVPTESQYARDVIAPRLRQAGHDVTVVPYDTQSGDEIAQRFIEEHPELLLEPVAFARVANAGVQLAVQFRKAARRANPAYDSKLSVPSVFILTDRFPVAQTREQASPDNAKDFQNPFTGIRQVALTGKLLVEAAQG